MRRNKKKTSNRHILKKIIALHYVKNANISLNLAQRVRKFLDLNFLCISEVLAFLDYILSLPSTTNQKNSVLKSFIKFMLMLYCRIRQYSRPVFLFIVLLSVGVGIYVQRKTGF